jgi:hypothetical protein
MTLKTPLRIAFLEEVAIPEGESLIGGIFFVPPDLIWDVRVRWK